MRLISLFFLTFLSISTFAFPDFPKQNTQQPAEAYACEDCNSLNAEYIAIRNAPRNNCNLYRNGPIASYCESVTKEILVPVHKTREIFKFIVTTSIDIQNRPDVSFTSFPLTSNQLALMNQYLDFNEELVKAVSNANLNANLSARSRLSKSTFMTSLDSFGSNNQEGDCDSHPTAFFTSLSKKRQIRNSVATKISSQIDGATDVEFTHESLLSGGEISLSKDGGGINVNLNYVRNNLIAFTDTDFNNRLAFDVIVAGDPTRSNLATFTLTLNKEFTKIDGFKYSEIFGGGNADLTDTLVSNCLRDFIEKEGESVTEEPKNGGGTGTFNDPFTGPSTDLIDPSKFCRYSRRVTTCSTTDGSQQCTRTLISWVSPCN